MNRKYVFVASAALLLTAFVIVSLNYQTSQAKQSAETAERHKSILVRSHSPSVGNPDAKVHIVEFLDPACETCRSFYPLVKKLVAANPGKIRLSIRYAPFHHGSDSVVKILEAARKQGRYWETLEVLLATQPNWVVNHAPQSDLVWRQLDRAGLNLDRLWNDTNAPEVTGLVLQDIEDARRLDISKTPEFFVNGRALPSFGYEQLETLVGEELAKAYP